MRIAIDARDLSNTKTGLGNYINNLLKALAIVDKKNDYFYYVNNASKDYLDPSFDTSFQKCQMLGSHRRPLYSHFIGDLWEQFILPFDLKRLSIEIYHGTIGRLPFLKSNADYIVTIPDLIPFSVPQNSTRKYRIYNKALLWESVHRANGIVAISNYTKEDILRLFNLSEKKIRVIHLGVDPNYKVLDKDLCKNYIRNKYFILDEYVLFVGHVQLRKNLQRLVDAFAQVQKRIRSGHKLVLAGLKGIDSNKVVEFVEKIGLSKQVIFLGYIEDDDLPYLYNAASAFIFPSFYEGFGLPLLEAMACGVPVIAANATSIPEVVGDAAELFDPMSVQDMSDKIEDILSDETLREHLCKKGLERVKIFSWVKTALDTLAIYEEIYREKHSNLAEV